MLIGQASINLSANILSALLGLLSVFIFTRLFTPHDYGIYLLGLAFAAVVSRSEERRVGKECRL